MNQQNVQALWPHIHSLTVLAASGSFTAAAQRLGISKAAMSQRIADLERAAGVPLVRRTTRSVRLTEAGQTLVDSTREAYETIGLHFARVKEMAGEPRGLVRVTAPVALGRQQIVPRIPDFIRQYPAVRIELDLSDRLYSLTQEGFDLAIRHATTAPQTHVAWKLCDTRSLLVASRAYLDARGTPAHPGELAEHDCLCYLRGSEPAAWSFEPHDRRRGRVSVPVRGSFAANNSEAMREAALGGLGIALLPDFSAQRDIDAGHLVTLLDGWRPSGAFGDHIFAIRPYSPVVPNTVRVLVRYLRTQLAGGFSRG
ncbi:LysR family transcriptional regulator [Burkholderia stagnalis]|uniref:LysR family transcriptional regulator n=1 Tax=Burkholderia stagnalis TaxID=1503054 RepID=UPI000F814875|nr:LysR family transcriptional regulator [Burkholderia stagnalis]